MKLVGVSIAITLLSIVGISHEFPTVIKIGGLFSEDEEEEELIFRYAVDTLNVERSILLRSNLEAQIERVGRHDSFNADKKVCGLLQKGVAAILGPSNSVASMHVQSICDALEIPHLETRWDTALQRDDLSINLHPKPSVLARAFLDLVKYLKWEHFCVVYEDYDGLIRLQDFLKSAKSHWIVKFYKFNPGRPYRETYWDIKKSGETNIVLDVRTENINKALKHAQQVGLITENHSYLVTSLDLHTIDLEDYKFSKAKITSFQLIELSSPDLMGLKEKWSQLISKFGKRQLNVDYQYRDIKTETALIFDAIKLLANAIKSLDGSQSIDVTPTSCEDGIHWQHGSSLLNYMRSTEFSGMTGLVKFDQSGYRSSFALSVMTMIPRSDTDDFYERSLGHGLQKVGMWRSDARQTETLDINTEGETVLRKTNTVTRKKYRVTTILNDPFTMRKENSIAKSGNDQFEGFVIDLIEKLAQALNFDYEIKLVSDKAYGAPDKKTGEWNGMIREVMDDKADMAIADLTINSKRESVVDFTQPFMSTGISILFRKPTKKVTTLFSFLSPFSMVVWVYVVGAYVGVSVILFVVGRLSPYEWDNPHPCRQDDQVLENDFSLLNSFWFTIGSLMQQGSDLAPKSMSTRTIAGIWYFFTLIMISSYTANLAAFLTVEKVVYPIETVEDLANQKEIDYGCVGSGSTMQFFENSKVPTYQKIAQYLNSTVLPRSNKEGKERVLRGNYAFFMESASIEYLVERECNLTEIGSRLDSKGYGIATRAGSGLTQWLSPAILQLQEDGTLQRLKDKWWKQKRGGGACADDAKKGSSSVTELSLGNVGGVFVVLIGGMAFALVTALCEFAWRARKMATNRRAMFHEMIQDLKFALSCQSSTKAARNHLRYSGYIGPPGEYNEKQPPGPGFLVNY